MQALAVVYLVPPLVLTAYARSRHLRVANRERAQFFAELEKLGFRVEGTTPWVARGEYEGHATTVTNKPVGLSYGQLHCTRITMHAPSETKRACLHVRGSQAMRQFANLEELKVVPLSAKIDKEFRAAAVNPDDLVSRLTAEKRTWIEERGSIFWIEIGEEDTTLCIHGSLESIPLLLDGLDFVAGLVDQRTLTRPPRAQKLRLMSYWSLVLVAPIFATLPTLVLCELVQVPPFSRASSNNLADAALSFDLVWGVMVGIVGLLALVRPLKPARTD